MADSEKPAWGNEKQLLQNWLDARREFAEGKEPSFLKIADLTVQASVLLDLPKSTEFAGAFSYVKAAATDTASNIDNEKFEKALLDRNGIFYNLFRWPGCSVAELDGRAIDADLCEDIEEYRDTTLGFWEKVHERQIHYGLPDKSP